MSDPYVGEIRLFSFSFAPVSWAQCNGQTINVAQNQALYALIGNTYGGTPSVNFNLPNLQGRVAVSQGPQEAIGVAGGSATMQLTLAQLPLHSHAATTVTSGSVSGLTATTKIYGNSANTGVSASPSAAVPAVGNTAGTLVKIYSPNTAATTVAMDPTMAVTTIAGSATLPSVTTIGNTGTGGAFSLMQPFLPMNYSIALQGLFPTRN